MISLTIARTVKSRSMRQNSKGATTPDSDNASTCGFLTRNGLYARGFRNLPHTSGGRFRKCGVKPRSVDQTPVLRTRDLRFCYRKWRCARRFPFFPALPENVAKADSAKAKTLQMSISKQPPKHGNRLSVVFAGHSRRTTRS